jgi:hypothetical protein
MRLLQSPLLSRLKERLIWMKVKAVLNEIRGYFDRK